MVLEQMTSTGCVTTKGRHLSLSRTQVDMCLVALLQFLGQAQLLVAFINKHQAPSSSHSQTCMESSPQSSPSKKKITEMLFGIGETTGLCLEVVATSTFHQIAMQTHPLVRPSQTPTTTPQEKEKVFSQAAQAHISSKFRKLKCSKFAETINNPPTTKKNLIAAVFFTFSHPHITS